jgi:hypothetical protein
MSKVVECADGVVCLAAIDWWYHNRGHSECQILRRIARSEKVLWVNSIGMRMPRRRDTEVVWGRYFRKARSMLRGLRRDEESGMYVLSPWFVPSYSEKWTERNSRLVLLQIRLACWLLRIRHPSVWATLPTIAGALERGSWTSRVVNRCDEYSAIPDANRAVVERLERRLVAASDHALYVSHELLERERGYCRNPEYFGHGVDYQRFSSARPLDGPSPDRPDALSNATAPIVGFYGGMDDYRIDRELVLAIAHHIAPATVVLIGPAQMDLSKIRREPNVIHIEQLAHNDLPRYAAAFDVGVIPFLLNDFNYSCNPIKLKEYLALGFPIVAPRLPAFEKLEGLIRLADDQDEFLAQLDLALAESGAETTVKRRDRVKHDSWDVRAIRAAKLLRLNVESL